MCRYKTIPDKNRSFSATCPDKPPVRCTADITGVPVDKITMDEALLKARSFLSGDKVCTIFTPNSEFMMKARRDQSFRQILRSADLCVPDGSGVVLASRILGTPLPEKVSGIDLVMNLFRLCAGKPGSPDDPGCSDNALQIKFYFLGGRSGIAEEAAANVEKQYPGTVITGFRDGFFTPDEEPSIIQEINRSSPDVLLVALSQVKQEKFIYDHRDELKVKICMGVGGTFDVLAGKASLAPDIFRRHGMEWFYRLCRQPSRFRRMLDLPKFILLVTGIRLKIVRRGDKTSV